VVGCSFAGGDGCRFGNSLMVSRFLANVRAIELLEYKRWFHTPASDFMNVSMSCRRCED
jgi:hypothetical protein